MTVKPIHDIDQETPEDTEHALRTAERRVNILWEVTQAGLAVMIAAAVIYLAIEGRESKTLELAFMTILAMYFTRTNHTKTGGVGGQNEPSPR
jgi:hypothetical protein